MTKTISDSHTSRSTAAHSSSASDAPRLCAATRSPTAWRRFISPSACRSGPSRLEPTMSAVIFIRSCDAFDAVFQTGEGVAQLFDDSGLGLPEAAPLGFEQARDERARRVRVEARQAAEHLGVEDVGARHLFVDPVVHGV